MDDRFGRLLALAMEETSSIEEATVAAMLAYETPPLPKAPAPKPVSAHFAHDIYDRAAQGILNRAMQAARKLSAQARRDLDKALSMENPEQALHAVVAFLERYRVAMARLLGSTQLAALLEGAREVARHVPAIPPPGMDNPPPSLEPAEALDLVARLRSMEIMERERAIYELPPDQQRYVRQAIGYSQNPPPPIVLAVPSADSPEHAQWPVIEEAVKLLREKNAVTREEYDRFDAQSRAKAFTITGLDSTEVIRKFRDALAEATAKGPDFREFRKTIASDVETHGLLADPHLEVVFRNGIQTAFADGQFKVLSHPFVHSGFPYVARDAIHDDRVRKDHKALETVGIQETNIYRTDDPVWRRFRAPWADNCVPADSQIVTSEGRKPIEDVRRGDLVLTHGGTMQRVLGTRSREGVSELVAIQLESGAFCRATGEHRFLTQRGWVEAASMNVGDEIYQMADATAPNLVMLVVDESLESQGCSDTDIAISIGMTRISFNLNANRDGRKIKIQPKWKGLLVENVFDPTFREGRGKRLLMTAHTDDSVGMHAWVAPNRFTPTGDHLRAYFGSASRAFDTITKRNFLGSFWMKAVMDAIGETATTDERYVVRTKNADHRTIGDAADTSDISHGRLLVDVVADEAMDTARPPDQLCLGILKIGSRTFWLFSHGYNCNWRKSKIKALVTVPFSGFVFNLSVENDESYLCDGLVSHNCRCADTYLSVKQAATRGVDEAQRWLETGVEPETKAWVSMPDFAPGPRFDRLAGAPLSVRLSMESVESFAEPEEAETPTGLPSAEKPVKHPKPFKTKRRVRKRKKSKVAWRKLGAQFSLDAHGKWHGPKPPGPDWEQVSAGPKGGLVWQKREGSTTGQPPTDPQMAAPGTAPAVVPGGAPPEPLLPTESPEERDSRIGASTLENPVISDAVDDGSAVPGSTGNVIEAFGPKPPGAGWVSAGTGSGRWLLQALPDEPLLEWISAGKDRMIRSGAMLGMVGDEWHGPNPPGKGWVQLPPGPRGGLRWRRKSHEQYMAETKQAAPQPQSQPFSGPGAQSPQHVQQADSPLKGKSAAQVASVFGSGAAAQADNPNPLGYNEKTYPEGVDPYIFTSMVRQAVKQQAAKNPLQRLTLPQIYAEVSTGMEITPWQFQNALAKMHADKQIRLSPFTQAITTHPAPDQLMPLDREFKWYVSEF